MSNQNVIPDPIVAGLARGWKVVDGARETGDRILDADVVIVGSGAGGGVTAEILALSGLSVIVVEEGALKSSSDFRMREADAYPALYQESAARKTRDKGINILQGRTVGGSTTVNWTSSFRTPPTTLAFWQQRFGLSTYGAKNQYQRARPFVVHQEGTCYPADESLLRNDGSYPSGHSAVGWGLALVLAELAPDRADALIQRGQEFGQSRVVCEAHWQSDVDAGRVIAAATVA